MSSVSLREVVKQSAAFPDLGVEFVAPYLHPLGCGPLDSCEMVDDSDE